MVATCKSCGKWSKFKLAKGDAMDRHQCAWCGGQLRRQTADEHGRLLDAHLKNDWAGIEIRRED